MAKLRLRYPEVAATFDKVRAGLESVVLTADRVLAALRLRFLQGAPAANQALGAHAGEPHVPAHAEEPLARLPEPAAEPLLVPVLVKHLGNQPAVRGRSVWQLTGSEVRVTGVPQVGDVAEVQRTLRHLVEDMVDSTGAAGHC